VKLAFAMLADAATVAAGKLYVHGGGWCILAVDALPMVYPSFSLVFVLELDEADVARTFALSVDLVDSSGAELGISANAQVSLVRPVGMIVGSRLVAEQVTFVGVPFQTHGRYGLRISSDGQKLGQVDLDVILAPRVSADG
jgi:hypothetical protein